MLDLPYYEEQEAELFENFCDYYDSLLGNMPQDRINAVRMFYHLLLDMYDL
jgi:hypothetical protein